MEFDEFKENWKNAGHKTKSQLELQGMTKVRNHPVLKRIRLKLLIEAVLLSAFLVVYHDFFDGAEKPFWINGCLIASAVLFLLNDLAGFFTLQQPVSGSNLTESVGKLRLKLKHLLRSSVTTSLFFGASLILFFSWGIDFTQAKYLLLAGMILGLLLFTYLSYKSWLNRLKQIQQSAEELDEAAE